MWDTDASIYAADRTTIEACRDGSGDQPPHTMTVNNGPRAIHDTIDICPWYIRWLSQNGWPMSSRWNEPGAVRSLKQSAMRNAPNSPMTAMDYLQELDQKVLSAMSLARPVTLSQPVAVPPQKIWTDCVNNPNAQNPYSLGFFTTCVQKIEIGYIISMAGAILGYGQPRDPGNKRKREGSFIQRPKGDKGLLLV